MEGHLPESSPPPALSIIVPAYNEADRLPETLRRILSFAEARGDRFEVLVVDDGSEDRTREVASQVRPGRVKVQVLSLPENRGKGAAVRAGMRAARGAQLLFTDADLSTPIEELVRLEEALHEGAAIAIGSRAVPGSQVVVRQPWYRQTMGKLFNLFVQFIALPGVRDSQCGFKLFRRDAAQVLFGLQRLPGFSFDVEVLFLAQRLGYSIAEVPVRWYNSPASRVHPVLDSARMLRDLFRIRWAWLRGVYRRSGGLDELSVSESPGEGADPEGREGGDPVPRS